MTADTRISPIRITGGGPLAHEPSYRLGRMIGAMENIVRILDRRHMRPNERLAEIREWATRSIAEEEAAGKAAMEWRAPDTVRCVHCAEPLTSNPCSSCNGFNDGVTI